MADITKCRGSIPVDPPQRVFVCPWRSKCLRYTAMDSPWQSWFTEVPLQRDPKTDAVACEYGILAS